MKNAAVEPTLLRKNVTSRVIRPGETFSEEHEWANSTPEERINAVWELTLLCLAWQGNLTDEPRLKDLLATFNAHGVEYLVVGAYTRLLMGISALRMILTCGFDLT